MNTPLGEVGKVEVIVTLTAFALAILFLVVYYQLPSDIIGDFGCNATKFAQCFRH